MDPSVRGYGGQGAVQSEIDALPYTGMDVEWLVLIALALFFAGVIVYLSSRS